MEYERLTNNNRDKYDTEYDFCNDCKYFGEPCGCNRPNGTCDNYDRFLETYNRLAKLEDKIEAGTLVTVPYAIGQELYCVSLLCKDIEKVKVSLISIRQNGDIDIRLNYYTKNGGYWGCFKYDTKYYELFDNEEEAEKRLEELKNGNNDRVSE